MAAAAGTGRRQQLDSPRACAHTRNAALQSGNFDADNAQCALHSGLLLNNLVWMMAVGARVPQTHVPGPPLRCSVGVTRMALVRLPIPGHRSSAAMPSSKKRDLQRTSTTTSSFTRRQSSHAVLGPAAHHRRPAAMPLTPELLPEPLLLFEAASSAEEPCFSMSIPSSFSLVYRLIALLLGR